MSDQRRMLDRACHGSFSGIVPEPCIRIGDALGSTAVASIVSAAAPRGEGGLGEWIPVGRMPIDRRILAHRRNDGSVAQRRARRTWIGSSWFWRHSCSIFSTLAISRRCYCVTQLRRYPLTPGSASRLRHT